MSRTDRNAQKKAKQHPQLRSGFIIFDSFYRIRYFFDRQSLKLY